MDERLLKRGPSNLETGKRLMAEILQEGLTPEIVIAEDDYVGYGALESIKKHGLKVPEDVQVLGIGGFLKNSVFCPGLSTISIPFFKLGEEAAKMVTNIAKGSKEPNKKEVIAACTLDCYDTFSL